MLQLIDLRKTLPTAPPRELLRGVDLELSAGDYVAIMGESGSGKSTLLNLIAALDTPSAGRILLDEIDLAQLGDDAATRLRAARMGFVFQAFHVLPHLSVAQNVALPLVIGRVPRDRIALRVAEMLEAVDLGARGEARPRELSGGELQRVAIARALVHGPSLVLADEPTGNLDPDTAERTLELLRTRIKQAGAIGILVTHSRTAAGTADRVFQLGRDGRLHAS